VGNSVLTRLTAVPVCESGPRAAMLLDSVSKSRTNPFPGREAKTLLLCPVFLWFDCHFEFARLVWWYTGLGTWICGWICC